MDKSASQQGKYISISTVSHNCQRHFIQKPQKTARKSVRINAQNTTNTSLTHAMKAIPKKLQSYAPTQHPKYGIIFEYGINSKPAKSKRCGGPCWVKLKSTSDLFCVVIAMAGGGCVGVGDAIGLVLFL